MPKRFRVIVFLFSNNDLKRIERHSHYPKAIILVNTRDTYHNCKCNAPLT